MTAIERVLLAQTLDAIARLSRRSLSPLDLAALLQAVAQTLRTQGSAFHAGIAEVGQRLTAIVAAEQDAAATSAQALAVTEALRLRLTDVL